MPDTSLPPPLTIKDIQTPAQRAEAPAAIMKDEAKKDAATPAAAPAEPAKAQPRRPRPWKADFRTSCAN